MQHEEDQLLRDLMLADGSSEDGLLQVPDSLTIFHRLVKVVCTPASLHALRCHLSQGVLQHVQRVEVHRGDGSRVVGRRHVDSRRGKTRDMDERRDGPAVRSSSYGGKEDEGAVLLLSC